jgi:hypothetical protein
LVELGYDWGICGGMGSLGKRVSFSKSDSSLTRRVFSEFCLFGLKALAQVLVEDDNITIR